MLKYKAKYLGDDVCNYLDTKFRMFFNICNLYIILHVVSCIFQEMRVTRTIARSFCPEYNHHVELPCPLLLAPGEGEEDDDDVMSLAEALESADLILQVWHQVPGFRTGED